MSNHWILSVLALAGSSIAGASPLFVLSTATGHFAPSFRGGASSTYLGWDRFGEPGNPSINDATPDVGSGAGSFVTTNGQNHRSGSGNFYSGSGTVAETVTFAPVGTPGEGFTTVIVQATTLFGAWGSEILFGPIGGVEPSLVVQAVNATDAGQLFVKYEVPAAGPSLSFTIGQGTGGDPTSFGLFTVDSTWSATAFAADSAVAVPEPAAALLVLSALVAAPRRR